MNKSWLIGLTCWSIGMALLGIAWQAQQDKAERQIAYNQGYVDREVIKEVPYSLTDNSTISANLGLAILDILAEPHAYMIAHPELQSSVTGNTTFNQSILIEYSAVEDLIKWQQNRILGLSK